MAIHADIENNSVQADIVEPLIHQRKIHSNEEGESPAGQDRTDESGKGSVWMVYFSTIISVWGSYEFGSCAGYSSPTQTAIRKDLNLSLSEYSVFGSILTIGAMIGAITSGPIADFIGRKGAMRTSVASCVAGWLAIYFAEGALALYIGRLCTGYGMGVFSYVVPVFIAEIAPKNLRGQLTTLNQLMIVSGVSVSFLIGNFVTWRTLALIGLIPCLILIVGLFLIPESPRWLAKIGREKDFEVALQKLRGKDANITHEATEIKDYIETLEKLPKARMFDLFQRRYLRSVVIGVGLMVCQQFGGINGVSFYVSEIFVSAGIEDNTVQADIVKPLIYQRKIHSNEEDEAPGQFGTEENSKGSVWMVYFSTIIAVWGSYEFGCCAGYSSPTQTAIREDLNLSLSEYSVVGSILTIGAMIGAITSGPIADFIGRKGAMRTSVAFCVAGWLAIYFAEGAISLDIGRLCTGYGMGVFSYVVPVFIAEIAPKNLRGRLTTLNQLMITIGVSVSFLIGNFVTWRTLALIGLVPCFILLVGLFLIPESPRWLAKIGRQEEFEVALRRFRGKDADITLEANEIQDYIETLEKLPKTKMLDLFQRRYLRSVIIGVGLMVCQQFGGINGICFYVSEIFVSAGFPSNIGTTIYACIQVVLTALGATLIDKAGRRALLLTSGTGLVIGCLLTAIAFYMKVHEFSLSSVPVLAAIGILVYISSFSIGMGAVPWVVMSEVFPINIKGAAGSLATLVNWFGSWVCSYTFNYLMSWSSYGTFIIYAVTNALAILFIAVLVPETKGRTLEELQAAINKS